MRRWGITQGEEDSRGQNRPQFWGKKINVSPRHRWCADAAVTHTGNLIG